MKRFTVIKAAVLLIILASLSLTVWLVIEHHKTAIVPATHTSGINTSLPFNYGFDFSDQEPDVASQDTAAKSNNSQAVAAARRVMATFAGSIMDQSIYGFGGQVNPEPSAGAFNLSSITPRIDMITNAGGIPVITLVQAPQWMHDGTGDPNNASAFSTPPSPDHYQDFAALCAHIAQAFPQVKNFVVWSEMRGFYNNKTKTIDAQNYTTMYNDVYTAIKAARPDALVGGPYATMSAYSTPQPGSTSATLHGDWGYIDANAQTALSYWLTHKVGADFLAIDGKTEIASADSSTLTNPLTASQKYAVVDVWLKSQTSLPIWWMESHIQPTTGWTAQQAAAARVATLAIMASSGASVGLQWQPQEQSHWADQGLWTSTEIAGGGQPTILGQLLPKALTIIRQSPTLASGQPSGVLVATSKGGTLTVNTTNTNTFATVSGARVNLSPGQVEIQ